jgi:hypothetical protein
VIQEREPGAGRADHTVNLISNPADGSTGSAGDGTTAVTVAAGGPTGRRRVIMSSILAGSPERSASTLPSRRLRTQPARPRDSAVEAVQSRNPTPVTRPFTTTRTAFCAGSGCGCGAGGDEAAAGAEVAMAPARCGLGLEGAGAWRGGGERRRLDRTNVLEGISGGFKAFWASSDL